MATLTLEGLKVIAQLRIGQKLNFNESKWVTWVHWTLSATLITWIGPIKGNFLAASMNF